jgi:hypothetical protein
VWKQIGNLPAAGSVRHLLLFGLIGQPGQNFRSLKFSQQRSCQADFLLSTHRPLSFNSLSPLSSCPLCCPLPGNADPALPW